MQADRISDELHINRSCGSMGIRYWPAEPIIGDVGLKVHNRRAARSKQNAIMFTMDMQVKKFHEYKIHSLGGNILGSLVFPSTEAMTAPKSFSLLSSGWWSSSRTAASSLYGDDFFDPLAHTRGTPISSMEPEYSHARGVVACAPISRHARRPRSIGRIASPSNAGSPIG